MLQNNQLTTEVHEAMPKLNIGQKVVLSKTTQRNLVIKKGTKYKSIICLRKHCIYELKTLTFQFFSSVLSPFSSNTAFYS